jgi:hypothetical protein
MIDETKPVQCQNEDGSKNGLFLAHFHFDPGAGTPARIWYFGCAEFALFVNEST